MDIRNIEKAWRFAWMRAIASQLPGPRKTTLPARPLKVLFLRYERIGDMIMATGMIRVLAQVAAGRTVDVVANTVTLPVLENNAHVGKAFVLDRQSRSSYIRLAKQLRAERYDVVVDGRINNPPVFTSTPLLMLAAAIPYRVGVEGPNNHRVYNVLVKPFDRVTHYIEASKALIEPFGVNPADYDWRPEIFLTDAEQMAAEAAWATAAPVGHPRGSRFLLNLSASENLRRWPDERFIEAMRLVRERYPHMPVIVIALPAEADRARAVANAIGGQHVPTPKLREAFALVASSDLVFTPDTSISHAASAFDKPALVLIKADCTAYAPWQNRGELILWQGRSIDSLPVSDVSGALLRFCAEFAR